MNRVLKIIGLAVVASATLSLTALQLSGCRIRAEDARLDLNPETKPYSLSALRGPTCSPSAGQVMALAMCDLDGDGVPELVEANTDKLLGYDEEDAGGIKVRWEMHLADGFVFHHRTGVFAVCHDFNGDHVEEMYIPVVSRDGTQWRFIALDPARQEFFLDTALPVGEDRRRADGWDGHYIPTGVLDDADGQGNPGVVLVREVGYDATLRGVCVVSPFTGQIIWEYVSGAQPAGRGVVVDDFDGDGRQEICIMTSAPDNLGGQLINGTSDDRSYLIALDNLGHPLFSVEQARGFSNGELQALDFGGDGRKELVRILHDRQAGGNSQISILAWPDLRVVASTRRGPIFNGLAVQPGPAKGTYRLFTGSDNGSLTSYLYQNEQLIMERQILQDQRYVQVLGQGDILPSAGKEIVACVGKDGAIVVLDAGLKTLGVYSGDEGGPKSEMALWQRQPDRTSLIVASSTGQWVLDSQRNPGRVLALLVKTGLALVGLAALVGMFVLGRNTGRRHLRREQLATASQAPADRQALFQLFRELSDINHQVVGKAKGLARLIWLLEAYSADMGANEELEQRIGQVLVDFRESVHPLLASILKQAEDAAFEPGTVQTTGEVLATLADRLEALVEPGLDAGRVAVAREQLAREWDLVQQGFLHLHDTIVDYFTTDPVRMVQGMLLVRAEEFKRAGIKARFVGAENLPSGHLVQIDSGDLRFVLDNLLDNALRAMQETGDGLLLVQLTGRDKEVALHVTDNGQGIEPYLHEEIFSSRFSSRRGGGLGLHRSREIMERWGGEISLADSRPGQGTTFIVKLLAAAGRKGPRARQASA